MVSAESLLDSLCSNVLCSGSGECCHVGVGALGLIIAVIIADFPRTCLNTISFDMSDEGWS